MEKIKTNGHNDPALHFAIAAITMCKDGEALMQNHPVGRGYLEVELKVDGVVVPFEKTITDIYNRFEADIDQRAAQKALDHATLGPLYQKLRGIEYEIKTAIETAFNVTLPER